MAHRKGESHPGSGLADLNTKHDVGWGRRRWSGLDRRTVPTIAPRPLSAQVGRGFARGGGTGSCGDPSRCRSLSARRCRVRQRSLRRLLPRVGPRSKSAILKLHTGNRRYAQHWPRTAALRTVSRRRREPGGHDSTLDCIACGVARGGAVAQETDLRRWQVMSSAASAVDQQTLSSRVPPLAIQSSCREEASCC